MSTFEKIQFESVGFNASANEFGVYFEVEENYLLIDFDEKLNTCDIVLMARRIAEKLFEKRSLMEKFARERGFKTRYDYCQYMFVFEKEMPWNE